MATSPRLRSLSDVDADEITGVVSDVDFPAAQYRICGKHSWFFFVFEDIRSGQFPV
jgi:hypothetical protein